MTVLNANQAKDVTVADCYELLTELQTQVREIAMFVNALQAGIMGLSDAGGMGGMLMRNVLAGNPQLAAALQG